MSSISSTSQASYPCPRRDQPVTCTNADAVESRALVDPRNQVEVLTAPLAFKDSFLQVFSGYCMTLSRTPTGELTLEQCFAPVPTSAWVHNRSVCSSDRLVVHPSGTIEELAHACATLNETKAVDPVKVEVLTTACANASLTGLVFNTSGGTFAVIGGLSHVPFEAERLSNLFLTCTAALDRVHLILTPGRPPFPLKSGQQAVVGHDGVEDPAAFCKKLDNQFRGSYPDYQDALERLNYTGAAQGSSWEFCGFSTTTSPTAAPTAITRGAGIDGLHALWTIPGVLLLGGICGFVVKKLRGSPKAPREDAQNDRRDDSHQPGSPSAAALA